MSSHRMLPVLAVCAGAAVLAAGRPAAAEEYDFLRLVQASKMGLGSVASSYSLEVKRGIAEYQKSEGGGGGGGGLGGKKDYSGVNHRIFLYVGVSRWLVLGLEQTIKQQDWQDLAMGVIAPEVVLSLASLDLPVDLSFFAGPRIRAAARRGSTMTMGFGLEKEAKWFDLAARVAFETGVEAMRENGLRYKIGAAFTVVRPLTLSLEAWGALVWPEDSVFQQDHHAGPSVMVRMKNVWLAVNAGVGMKERPSKIFVDYGVMFQLGVCN